MTRKAYSYIRFSGKRQEAGGPVSSSSINSKSCPFGQAIRIS